MARNRMIKPDFWEDEIISLLSDKAKLTYIGLWNFADDEGLIRYNPAYIKSCIFPYDEILTNQDMKKILKELESFLMVYQVNGQEYAYIKNFKKHQKINRPQTSKLPSPPYDTTNSLNNHGTFTEDSRTKEKEKEKEEVKEKGKDIFCNPDFQKSFTLYAENCKNLLPILFEKRNKDVLNLLGEVLNEIEYDFEQFKELCIKANNLGKIVNSQIDFKSMLKNYIGILSGKYETNVIDTTKIDFS